MTWVGHISVDEPELVGIGAKLYALQGQLLATIRHLRDENRELCDANDRLQTKIDVAVDYLSALMRAMGSRPAYKCLICGAEPEDEHNEGCDFLAAQARLHGAVAGPMTCDR